MEPVKGLTSPRCNKSECYTGLWPPAEVWSASCGGPRWGSRCCSALPGLWHCGLCCLPGTALCKTWCYSLRRKLAATKDAINGLDGQRRGTEWEPAPVPRRACCCACATGCYAACATTRGWRTRKSPTSQWKGAAAMCANQRAGCVLPSSAVLEEGQTTNGKAAAKPKAVLCARPHWGSSLALSATNHAPRCSCGRSEEGGSPGLASGLWLVCDLMHRE